MQESVVVQGKLIKIGSVFRGTQQAEKVGICSRRAKAVVKAIKNEDTTYIGLYSENGNKLWGSLDGMVPAHRGYWQDAEGLFVYFELIPVDRIVAKTFEFKKKDLKGKKCTILCENAMRSQCLVEFDENIGGGCGDGMGKTGHCIVIPTSFLCAPDEEDLIYKSSAEKKETGVPFVGPISPLENVVEKWHPGKHSEKIATSIHSGRTFKKLDPEGDLHKYVVPPKKETFAWPEKEIDWQLRKEEAINAIKSKPMSPFQRPKKKEIKSDIQELMKPEIEQEMEKSNTDTIIPVKEETFSVTGTTYESLNLADGEYKYVNIDFDKEW